jgi:hypothetical protein
VIEDITHRQDQEDAGLQLGNARYLRQRRCKSGGAGRWFPSQRHE